MDELKKGFIKRFEGDYGIVEIDGETEGIPKNLFPANARPGDSVELFGTMITIIENETEKLKIEMEEIIAGI
jgi:hypothetical protein